MGWHEDTDPHINAIESIKIGLKHEDRMGKREQPKKIDSGFTCDFCKVKIVDDCYYRCFYHKTIHCKKCATKKGQFKSKDFPKCRQQKLDHKDCIFERKYIDE